MTMFYVENDLNIDMINIDELKSLIDKNKEILKSPRIMSYKGYKLEVACNPLNGNLMGYIEGDFDKVESIYNEAYVHGGWTYPFDELDSSKPTVKIGFDCGHASDLTEVDIEIYPLLDVLHYKSYKNVGFVVAELKRVIDEYLEDSE